MAEAVEKQTGILAQLGGIVGEDKVLSDEQNRLFYSQDIFKQAQPALAIVRVENIEQLSAVIAAATSAGHAVIPRGGGMSYTGGYLPAEEGSIQIDMRSMNRVLEINEEDMYVTVECGCTWQDLHEALKDTGLRTPFWGTLSGIKATVGGGLSQNCIFWGSGRFGSAVDSVLSLDVVLADGSVLTTGSGSQKNGTPFFRHYGPDLSGLFCCDTGAFGFKATATFSLIRELPAKRFASFDFSTYEDIAAAMSEVSRKGLAMECFGFDPFLQRQRMQRESLAKDVKALAGVMKASDSVVNAIKDGARVALSGRTYMDDVDYSLHIMIEERHEDSAQAALDEVNEICRRNKGKEIEPSIPKILRANPFTPLNNVLGPQGERWAPVHAIVPHSKAISTIAKVEDIFSAHAETIEKYEIGVGYLFATISNNGFVIEPVFFWPDAMMEIHRDTMEDKILNRIDGFEENLQAREAVTTIRQALIDMFSEVGGVHLQIAKTYKYKEGLRAESWNLIDSIKQVVDPEHRVNPQSLGLD